MQRSNGARLVPLFIVLIVVALIIAAIVAAGRAFFGGNSDTTSTTQVTAGRQALLKTDVSRSVSMTVRGPIVADENFASYRVEISPTSRDLSVYSGYLDERTGGTRLANSTRAYEQFVYALDKANMMKGGQSASSDLRGICAIGYVYEFAVNKDDEVTQMLWTSTCSGSNGTLDASKEQLSNLFLTQIPNFEDLIPFRYTSSFRF